MEKVHVRLAIPADNELIQALVRAYPMRGAVDILLQKAPDYAAASAIRGDRQQTLAGFSEERLCVMVSRSLQQAYINGEPRTLGYLSDLRSDGKSRRARPLSTLGEFLREQFAATPAHLHIATIMDDNKAAKAALTWQNTSPAIPRFVDQGRFLTHLLPLLWKRGLSKPHGLMRGRPDMLEDIVRFLNTEGRTKQFFPAYTVTWLQNLPDFRAENFWVATENSNIVGVCAGWNQHRFKQAVIVRYNGKMRLMQRLLGNLLPTEGAELPHVYACFFATKGNSVKIFKTLLTAVYNDWLNREQRFMLLGLHETDPLNAAVRYYPRIRWPSRLYAADYADEAVIKARLDSRTPYLELATL